MTTNKERILAYLKKDSQRIVKLIHHQNKHTSNEEAKKTIISLEICANRAFIVDGKIKKNRACHLSFCPICHYMKSIKEYAITFQAIDELRKNNETNLQIALVSLSIPRKNIYEIENLSESNQDLNIKKDKKGLDKAFKIFLKTKIAKTNGKLVSFNDSLLGMSCFYHISLNETIGVHLHAILILKSSFKSDKYINQNMVNELWTKANNGYQYQSHIKVINFSKQDLLSMTWYGMNKINIDHAIENNINILELNREIKYKRFSSHSGIIRESKRVVKNNYKLNKTSTTC